MTLTFVASFKIYTNLTTYTGVEALIDITAGLAIDELESWRAVALVANRQVAADVRAASVIEQAFVHIALFDGFITPVRTVTDLITHFTHLNALSTPTLELVRTATLS